MNVIRSRQHNLTTEQVNKIALSANDDKCVIRSDKIQTFAHRYRTGLQCNRGSGKVSRLGHDGNWLWAGLDMRGTDLGLMGLAETWRELTLGKWGRLGHQGNWLGSNGTGWDMRGTGWGQRKMGHNAQNLSTYIDKYINEYSRVKPENIIKLKHYMHDALSFYQTKYFETTFLALPHLSYIIFNRPVVGKTKLLRQKSQQTHYYCRSATEVANACQYPLLYFQ